jgi:hypothetical protein
MITTHTTRSIEDYLNDFAGRRDMAGYDDAKRIKIGEENRDFVWSQEMCESLVTSIFAGFTVPLMVICDDSVLDGGNRSTALMKWRMNEFKVKFGDWEGDYAAMSLSLPLSARWNRCVIPMTIIANATREERSQIYENYNKGIVLTCGQQLWNRKYLPLVKLALSLIVSGDDFPADLRTLIHKVWRSKWKSTKTRSSLAFAYSVLAGSMFGPAHFHTKFHVHLDKMMDVTAAQIDLSNLRFICGVIEGTTDPNFFGVAKKKEFFFQKFIGAMIHDSFTTSHAEFSDKWKNFAEVYSQLTKEQLKGIIDVKTDRANNFSRVQRLSRNVSEFLEGVEHDGDGSADSSDSEDSD